MEKKPQYRHKVRGKIATLMENNSHYTIENTHAAIPAWIIETGEDWELITPQVEPEYTVIQWLCSGTIYQLCPDGKYRQLQYIDEKRMGWKASMMGSTDETIHQVRRNNDNTVWTVGDKYTSSIVDKPVRTIEKFVISSDGRMELFAVEDKDKKGSSASALEHLTVPVPVEAVSVITIGDWVTRTDKDDTDRIIGFDHSGWFHFEGRMLHGESDMYNAHNPMCWRKATNIEIGRALIWKGTEILRKAIK